MANMGYYKNLELSEEFVRDMTKQMDTLRYRAEACRDMAEDLETAAGEIDLLLSKLEVNEKN